MIRVMCDRCGKELGSGEAHHVVKIEASRHSATLALTDEDLDRDHLEEVAATLAEAEEEGQPSEPSTASLRYDLCGTCRRAFLQNPLAREAAPRLTFSAN
jgi:hypothetical protein